MPRDTWLLAVGLVILVLRVLWASVGILPIDDAYISFRYARNLAEGHGLVFNPGEPVEGYTNFLWTVLLAAVFRLGIDPVLAARVLSTAAAAATMVCLLGIGRRVLAPREGPHPRSWLPGVAPLLFASMGSQARLVATGMETLLLTALVTATALCVLRATSNRGWGWAVLAGAFGSSAALTRPEGLIFVGLMGLFLGLRTDRRRTVGIRWGQLVLYGGILATVVGGHLLWRLSYYGHPLPNTYYAKVGLAPALRIATGWEKLLQIGGEWAILPLLLVALLSLASLRRDPFWGLSWVAVATAVGTFVWVGGDFLAFFGPRFLLPALPFLLLAVSEGLWIGARLVMSGPARRGVIATAVLVLTLYCVWFTWPANGGRFEGVDRNHRAWMATGEWIRERAPEGATLATSAAGIIPYVTRLRTVDMFGLTDPHIARRGSIDSTMPPGHQKSDPVYVLDAEPDYLVVPWLNEEGVPGTARLGFVADRVARQYALVAQVKTRKGPPRRGDWVAEVGRFREDLYRHGYIMGVLERREVEGPPPRKFGTGPGSRFPAVQGAASVSASR